MNPTIIRMALVMLSSDFLWKEEGTLLHVTLDSISCHFFAIVLFLYNSNKCVFSGGTDAIVRQCMQLL